MQDSGFKEKKDNSGIFKNPLNFVKNLYGRKSEKGPGVEDARAPQMTREQKEQLLRYKYPSDEDPLDPFLRRQTTHASTSSTGTDSHTISGNSQEPKFIKLSSGAVVDNVHNQPQYQQPPFYDHSASPPRGPPPASFWSNPSSEGYGYRGGYGGGGTMGEYTPSFGSSRQDQRRLPGELDHEEASYETLLKEASMLREDLESERNRHRGTKEEFENKMTQTKQRIATAKTQQRLDPAYDDDIILLLSQELTVLEKKVKDMEARITPLDNTIDDIKGVERFIKDRELDSQQASMLFENIMKKMFDDLSLSGHVLTGEATHNFGMPRNVLDELQDKMLKSALKKSDPTRSGSAGDNQGLDWMEFDTEEERVTKISTSDSHEEALRKKRKELAREKFARVSRKLDQVVEFSQKRNKVQFQRAAAFRFNAVDRADAFKDVNYFAAPDLTIQEEDEESVISKSATSGVSTTEALQSLDESVWLGLNTATPIESSPGSVKQQGINSISSVGNVKDLETFPETKVDLSVSGVVGQDSKKETPVLADQGLGPAAWTGAQPPPLPLPPGTETAGFKLNIGLDFGQGGGGGPKTEQENSNEKTKAEGKTEETGSTADALNEVKLQKIGKAGSGSGTGVITDLDISSKTGQGGADLANLGLKITGETPTEEKPKTEVKTEIKIEEKPPKPKPTPPPPPPKKGAPPPPPGKKKPGPKGGPPPPPGGRKKANDGLTRAPEVIAMFQEMRKALLGNAAKGGGGPKKIGGGGAADPGALMDELSKNSKYAAQVQADIENYGEIIQGLITQVATFEPKDMPEMIEFVAKVDGVLSELSDETAVLKKFDWPQRYYTMLEAKGLYTELEKMKETFSPWKKTENKAVAEMQKIQKFMDKSKTRVDVIMRTKDSDEKKFKENKIPWNAKIFTEVKIASLSPLIAYMEVALGEVNNLMSTAPAEQGTMRKKALDKSLEHLNGTITFAFKVHQFTGGYTKECNLKFADISKKMTEIRGELSAMAS